ncbi:TIGR02450 family Trp-rich protein [Prochlorococcus marinus]|uniref:TIGR02450 family Trp-rich protein n=1 Tax=Prochlorococcus marinus TaxID=1219 RepID=UPI0022B3DD3D|nr:TIGR02450 family Trp-rich protein [Prochlorococcus marinus]
MRWPPNKAWTSNTPREGHRHFEVLEYGGKGEERWVTLCAIMDKSITIEIPWNELKIYANWTSGWLQLSDED